MDIDIDIETQKSNLTINKYNEIVASLKQRNVIITDYDSVLNFINKNKFSQSYIKVIFSAIVYKLKLDKIGDDTLIQKYNSMIKKIRIQLEKKTNNHDVKKVIPKWDDILLIRKNYKINYKPKGNVNNLTKHQAIIALYTYIPPRRVRDYSQMKFVLTDDETIDKKYNYYVKNTNKLVFNEYKTKKTFKQQIIKAPLWLKKALVAYIDDAKLESGTSLFNMNDKVLDNLVIRIFGGGVDMIRRSYVDNRFKDNNLPKNGELKNISNKMGHSLETHLAYRKNAV